MPLAAAFGCEIVHGRVVYGASLAIEVLKQIQTCDAMIGFTTRRDDLPGDPGKFTTHPWVVQELSAALTQAIPFVEVREVGVSPGGMIEAHNAQRIDYSEGNRAECLVQIAQALAKFREENTVRTIRLGPDAVVGLITENLEHHSFTCRVRTLRGGDQTEWRDVAVLPVRGGLHVRLRGVRKGELVQIAISAAGRGWRSDYETLDTVDVQLKARG
jgi:hypothetical protein